MIIHNYRSMIGQFFPLQQENNEVRTANLTQDRPVGEFIKMDALPGDSKSSIEKMTHPLGGYDETGSMSPYMIVLLGDQRALDFAEKVLQAPRQRLLDTLGIDDDNKADRHTRLHSELESLTRFYPNNPEFEPKKITLNDQPFIEHAYSGLPNLTLLDKELSLLISPRTVQSKKNKEIIFYYVKREMIACCISIKPRSLS